MPMFPAEAARPIMQYVRDLEAKVLTLRAERRWFYLVNFAAGLAIGAAAVFVLLRYLR